MRPLPARGGADPVEEDEPSLKMTDLLEVLENDDDDSTGGREGEGDDSKVEVVAEPSGDDVICLD